MKAVILAGGQATRLGRLADTRPKCLVEIAKRPILEWQLMSLADAGVDEVLICCRADQAVMIMAVAACCDQDLRTYAVVEGAPLGTAGALEHASDYLQIDEPFFVLNGDIIPGFPLRPFRDMGDPWDGGVVMGVRFWPGERWCPYGYVHLHFDGRVRMFGEPSHEYKEECAKEHIDAIHEGAGHYVNTGIYLMTPKIFDIDEAWPEERPLSLEHTVFPKLADKGLLWAHNCIGPWYAIDTPGDANHATEALSGRV